MYAKSVPFFEIFSQKIQKAKNSKSMKIYVKICKMARFFSYFKDSNKCL